MTEAARVFYFIWSLHRGGAERQLVELARGLDPSRYVPRLALCAGVDEFGLDLPTARHDLGAENGFKARHFARLVAAMRRERPAVVHSYMGSMNFYARLAARIARVPVVVGSVRCTQLLRADVVREALTWPMVDATVVNSVGIRDELVTRAHVPVGRIEVIENGIDLARFNVTSPEEREALRREQGTVGLRAIVVPGRVSEQKNQLALVEALAMLRTSGELPLDARFVFAGRDEQTDYARRVRAVVERESLGQWIEWRGVVDAMERLYGAADAVLLPSIFEGLPNVVIEAMACGVPTIVSPPANADGLVTDGLEGITLRASGPGEIAEGLRRLFRTEPSSLTAMGVEGRRHAERRFSTRVMVERTMSLYDRLRQRDRSRAGNW